MRLGMAQLAAWPAAGSPVQLSAPRWAVKTGAGQVGAVLRFGSVTSIFEKMRPVVQFQPRLVEVNASGVSGANGSRWFSDSGTPMRHLHADILARRHRAGDDRVRGGGAAGAGAGGIFQVDQRQRVAAALGVPVVVGGDRQHQRHLAAVGLDEADVGDVEAQVLQPRGYAACSQAGNAARAVDRCAAGARLELQADGTAAEAGEGRVRVAVAAAATGAKCREQRKAGCIAEECSWGFLDDGRRGGRIEARPCRWPRRRQAAAQPGGISSAHQRRRCVRRRQLGQVRQCCGRIGGRQCPWPCDGQGQVGADRGHVGRRRHRRRCGRHRASSLPQPVRPWTTARPSARPSARISLLRMSGPLSVLDPQGLARRQRGLVHQLRIAAVLGDQRLDPCGGVRVRAVSRLADPDDLRVAEVGLDEGARPRRPWSTSPATLAGSV